MKIYAVFSEGKNVFIDKRKFKTKRAAKRNLDYFLYSTIGHDAEIVETEEPSYEELKQVIKEMVDAVDPEGKLEINAVIEKHKDLIESVNEAYRIYPVI